MTENRRIITSSLTVNRPQHTTRTDARGTLTTALFIHVVKPLWRCRVELLLVFPFAVAWSALAQIDVVVASVLTALIVAGLLIHDRSRGPLLRLLRRRSVRRRFEKACRFAAVVSVTDRTPRITSVRQAPGGEILTVKMPKSLSTEPLVDASETLASTLRVKEVRVERLRDRADLATVSIMRRDPLGDGVVLRWPSISAQRLSIWDDIAVGVDELGETVMLNLIERNLSIGGEPGAGKSVTQSMITATAALDPECQLYLFDANRVEFAPWKSCASAFVGPSIDDAKDVLTSLKREMERRYELIESERLRKINRNMGLAPIVVLVNELAAYMNTADPKSDKVISGLLRSLVAQGRASGIICVTATQKPSSEVIPTYLRDLFAYRWALRCTTPQASDTILGQGWASQGYSAVDVDPVTKGVGYLLAEGGKPRRIKSFHLSDDDLDTLAARGAELRRPDDGEGTVTPIHPAA
jgi:hypothetical protein